MQHRDWKFRTADILDAIAAIQKYSDNMNFQQFVSDRKTVDAVIRNLIIIGESASHIPEEIYREFPEIPWAEMRGMRNLVVHEYFGVNDKILWDTIQIDLPQLLKKLQNLIDRGPAPF